MSNFEHTIIHPTQLPSRGLPYGDKLPGGKVEMAPMRTKEEKIFASTHDQEGILERIVERCLLTKVIPFEDYLESDYMYMLLVNRNLSYGADYRFEVKCRHCGFAFEHYMQVPDSFEIRILADGVTPDQDGTIPPKFVEPIIVDLPLCKKKVGLRLLRLKDEKEVRRLSEQRLLMQNPDDGDPSYEVRIAKHICQIDGKPVDIRAAIEFVENLYVRDTAAIKQAIYDNDCGVNLLINPECRRCGRTFQTRFRITPDFFRPSRV